MTKILELPEELMQQLESEAQAMKMTPEKWALTKLQRETGDLSSATSISDEKWGAISRGVIEDNRELLNRLAK